MDDLARAWATLGLRPGSSLRQVKSRFRRLARQWHPDRYASDSRNREEAASQMRVINVAYRRVLEAAANRPAPPPHGEAGGGIPPKGRRLTREEIDRMIASIGTRSWVDVAVDGLPYAHLAGWFTYRPAGPHGVREAAGPLTHEADETRASWR